MEQNTPGSPEPNSPFSAPPSFAAPGVWPPPPTNAPFADAPTPLAGFREQNVWLVLLLTLITGGIYAIFWLRRQAKQIHVLRPDLMPAGSLLFANILLGLFFLSTAVDLASLFSHSSALDNTSNIFGRGVGLAALVFLFQVRNGFNGLLNAQKGSDTWCNGLYTWLLSVVYLQHYLNKLIPRYQAAPSPYQGV